MSEAPRDRTTGGGKAPDVAPSLEAPGASRPGAATPAQPASPPAIVVEERVAMPVGFAAGSVAAGIKPSGRPDLAIVAATTSAPASAAAAFTRNLVAAAPVRLSRAHLRATGSAADRAGGDAGAPGPGDLLPHGTARAVIITAGSANAATGLAGDADQEEIARALAGAFGAPDEDTLLASTGLIGTRLPVERVAAGIGALVPAGLAATDAALAGVGIAMMTTDTRLKAATAEFELPAAAGGSARVLVCGIVKGVGMIHPGMATMIAILLTDAAVGPPLLSSILRPAIAGSFDQLTVDGDTSTNDTVFALASGASDAAPVQPGTEAADLLGASIAAVCRSLARQQALDGEGATRRITCRVTGAATLTDARAVSRTIAGSSLVKAAVHGGDPNWGRVAAAAGRAHRPDGSPVSLSPVSLRIALCGTPVFDGAPLPFDAAAVSAAMAAADVPIDVELGIGDASAEAWGCDLTEEYVRVNAEYST